MLDTSNHSISDITLFLNEFSILCHDIFSFELGNLQDN